MLSDLVNPLPASNWRGDAPDRGTDGPVSNDELADTTNLVAGQRTNARGNPRVVSNCPIDRLRVRLFLDIAKQAKRRHR